MKFVQIAIRTQKLCVEHYFSHVQIMSIQL